MAPGYRITGQDFNSVSTPGKTGWLDPVVPSVSGASGGKYASLATPTPTPANR